MIVWIRYRTITKLYCGIYSLISFMDAPSREIEAFSIDFFCFFFWFSFSLSLSLSLVGVNFFFEKRRSEYFEREVACSDLVWHLYSLQFSAAQLQMWEIY